MSRSHGFYDHVSPETARALLEGKFVRVHAVKISLVLDGDGFAWAGDTLPRDGRSDAWEKVTQRIGRILEREVRRLDPATQQVLATLAAVTAQDLLITTVETWLGMDDDGSSRWLVTATLPLHCMCLPRVAGVVERARSEVLEEVCRL